MELWYAMGRGVFPLKMGRVRESMDQGGRSAGLEVALTNSKIYELKKSGKNP